MKRSRIKIDSRISMLVVMTTAFAAMILGLAFIIFFVVFFSQQNRQSIRFVLTSTSRQMGDNIGFIEDGIISIRHNSQLEPFLLGRKGSGYYNPQQILASSIDIYSDRNRSDSANPFITRIYLFNVANEYVSVRYYPETVTETRSKDILFEDTEKEFRDSNYRFRIYEGTNEGLGILAIKIYDDELSLVGICALELNLDEFSKIFSPIEGYSRSSWEFGYYENNNVTEPKIIKSFGNEGGGSLKEADENGSIYQATDYSFGLYSVISVDESNVFFNFGGVAVFILVLSVAVLVFLALRIIHFIREVYQKELLATRTEVKFLQSQLNPHFQYNILAMLAIKAKRLGDEDLYQSLRSFSGLVRGKIFKEREIFIYLDEEMEMVEFYLHLQKDRFGDKITYSIRYDKETLGKCLIPKLIIEPLVENSVEHGLEPKGFDGHIDICISSENGMLVIMVKDNGVGIGSDEKKLTGTSLENTRQLLNVLYPGNHSIKIEGSEDEGTKVEIRIPVKYD